MRYRKGYKYQLAETLSVNVGILEYSIDTEFITLDTLGNLTIRSGYASDGPSGLTWDTDNFMEGAFVHDALYQLLRLELLPQSLRLECDEILISICKDNGMWGIRRWYVRRALKKFGASAADPKNKKRVYEV